MGLLDDGDVTPSSWVYVGIVGAEEAKFSPKAEERARALIRDILLPPGRVLVSGGCHLGGVDIWAEEEYAKVQHVDDRPRPIIHLPREHSWTKGYQPRNRLIVRDAAVLHNVVVDRYVPTYTGMRWGTSDTPVCYHCERRAREQRVSYIRHVKSGGCWTAYEAQKLGKEVSWHVVQV